MSTQPTTSAQSSEGILTTNQRNTNAAHAFEYVIEELFNQDMDGSVAKSLLLATEDVADIRTVLALSDEDIEDLHYYSTSTEDDAKKKIPSTKNHLGKGNKGLLRRLKHYEMYRRDQGNPILSDWSNVLGQEFDEFRITTGDINVSTRPPSQLFSLNTRNNSGTIHSPV